MNDSWCGTLVNSSYRLPSLPNYLTFPIYGVMCPIVAILTLISNVIVVCVFMTKKMRSVTTVFLAGLAIADTLSAVLWSVVHLVFYGIQNDNSDHVNYPGCMFHDYTLYLAIIFHTTSVWLTLTLGIQRWIIVVSPFSGPKLWTIRKSTFIVVMAYIIPLLVFTPLFFMQEYYPIYTSDKDNTRIRYCAALSTSWFEQNFRMYSIIYFVFRSVFIQLVPCILMMISTAILAHKLRTERILQRSVSRVADGVKKDFQHRTRTTLMVVIIMIIFLIVEIPNGVVFCIKFYENFANQVIMNEEVDYPFAVLHNFFLLLSYHTNFWIYIGLSARFRKTLQNLLFGFTIKKTVEEVFSMSGKTQNSGISNSSRTQINPLRRNGSSSDMLTSCG